jgi:hypothetical protein
VEIYREVENEGKEREKQISEINKWHHDMSQVNFLKKMDECFEAGTIDTFITQSRRQTLIYIFPLLPHEKQVWMQEKILFDSNMPSQEREKKLSEIHNRQRVSSHFICLNLDDIYEVLFEFHGNKCHKCGITNEESYIKYNDRGLELHHVHPIVYGNVQSVKITSNFIPLCPAHHRRGGI